MQIISLTSHLTHDSFQLIALAWTTKLNQEIYSKITKKLNQTKTNSPWLGTTAS